MGAAKPASSAPPEQSVQAPKSTETSDKDGALVPAPAQLEPPLTFGGVPLSEDDASALEQFCAELSYPQISYEAFSQTHRELDVVLMLYLTAEQCTAGGQVTVTFTRTVHEHTVDMAPAPGPQRPWRHQVSHDVSWPAGTSWHDVIRLKALGDQRGVIEKGDLVLRVMPVKSTSGG